MGEDPGWPGQGKPAPPGQPPKPKPTPAAQYQPLDDADIELIHSGLLIPNEQAVKSMAREIRKWRGDPNPDTI